ncbi:MAG: hypothetical protein NTW86_07930 [Candidatus Sumerlaeota bacterium]|nr:hypothetical protein [Candidatus Sumerlaeota bacterium]
MSSELIVAKPDADNLKLGKDLHTQSTMGKNHGHGKAEGQTQRMTPAIEDAIQSSCNLIVSGQSTSAKDGKAERSERHRPMPKILAALSAFFRWLRTSTGQLDWAARWRILLSRVFVWFLGGRLLTPPRLLEDSS